VKTGGVSGLEGAEKLLGGRTMDCSTGKGGKVSRSEGK
jgi:hypothetical protein